VNHRQLQKPAKRIRSRISSGVRHLVLSNVGLATSTATPRAREIATLKRFAFKTKSMPRGASSIVEVAIE
jgi:hypothetical protein